MRTKGFTLIEIIIVIVILGVLATIAFPRLSAQLDVGRSSEALSLLGTMKNAVLNCYDNTTSMSACNSLSEIGISIPSNSRFTYTLSSTGPFFNVIAVSNAVPTNCIKMSADGATGTVGMSGYGDLSGVTTRITNTAANGAGAGCGSF
jgi:prepilin-type N-terminal cleavage/methylation domain-containing protein